MQRPFEVPAMDHAEAAQSTPGGTATLGLPRGSYNRVS